LLFFFCFLFSSKVPNPKFPFLGVHLTRKLGGEGLSFDVRYFFVFMDLKKVFAGPGASLSLSRNHNKVFNLADLASIASSKGFWKLTLNNAAFAASQTLQAFSVSSFVKQTQRFVDFKVSAANVQGKKFGIRALGKEKKFVRLFFDRFASCEQRRLDC
jgi:L-2-hydroxyglutarate oxidase